MLHVEHQAGTVCSHRRTLHHVAIVPEHMSQRWTAPTVVHSLKTVHKSPAETAMCVKSARQSASPELVFVVVSCS